MQGIKYFISLAFSLFATFVIVEFTSNQLTAAEEKANEKADKPNFVLCRNDKNVRTIRVDKVEAKGAHCLAYYTKNGVDKEVGRALNYNSCLKVMAGVKSNLEKSNWKCKELNNVTITSTIGE